MLTGLIKRKLGQWPVMWVTGHLLNSSCEELINHQSDLDNGQPSEKLLMRGDVNARVGWLECQRLWGNQQH